MPNPRTSIRTDHSLSIRSNGLTIGRIQEWAPSHSRNVVQTYEINGATSGGVYETVPGNVTALNISIVRYDLYASKMEQAWGGGFDIYMLSDQRNPLTINEVWKNPDGSEEVWAYTGCWFTHIGRTHSAQGDRITKVNASLAYTRKYKAATLSYVGNLLVESLPEF